MQTTNDIIRPELREGDRFIVQRGQMICFNHPSGVIEHRDYGSTYGGGPIRTAAEAFETLYEAIPESYKTVADKAKELANKPSDNPSDMRNRWAKQLGAFATYDASKLLDLIRPEVEEILVIAGFTSPPSQSVRVRDCLASMEEKMNDLLDMRDEVMDPKLNSKQRVELQKAINTLKAFLAVHKTITILEGTVI